MVSILLAVYNGEKNLPDTLKSIEQQIYNMWELIAVDDGSTDGTQSMIRAFKYNYPHKVTILKNAVNIGLTRSLILATKEARGDCLARIDAGDIFSTDKLEKQIAFLDHNANYGIVGCNYINTFPPSKTKKTSNVPLTDTQIRTTILRKNPFAHSCIIIRRHIYQQAGGYDPNIRYGQDYELWFRVLKLTNAANLPDNLCTRTMSDESISYRKQKEQMWQCLKTRWKHMNKLKPWHYFYLIEPLSMALIPIMIKKMIRPH